jgi:hypothetical protein
MWTLEHSVECKVDRDFAWRFWTNVSNWPSVDSSLESATLDGQFQSGAKVISKPRGGEAIHGQIADVQDGSGATIIIPVPGAALRCAWRFEDSGTGRTEPGRPASMVSGHRITFRRRRPNCTKEYPRACTSLPSTWNFFP